ncbi:hypothetical protein GCM10020001_005630 [Nonomuraea salmonea]
MEQSVEQREPREGPVRLAPAAKRALLDARQVARATAASYIGARHLVLALSANPLSAAGRLLRHARLTPESFVQDNRGAAEPMPHQPPQPSTTPTLDQFGRDLTATADEGGIDPVIGRDDEITQAVEVLSRRTKNNPALLGEPGVGKTAIVEGLAQRIVSGEVPDTLRGKRVVQLDVAGLVAGTKYRGEFEERLSKLMEEIRAHSEELIVFIDELHTIVGAGGAEGAIDASNMLKPALARGELHVIGATTLDEYRRYMEKDAALERRFQPILVPEPTVEDTIEIMRGLRDRYEAHHQVKFTDDALVAAVELSDRYISDRFLPDKAIDLMDQAGARVALHTRTTPAGTREMEEDLEHRQREKDQAVEREDYDRARELRDEIAALKTRIEETRTSRRGFAEVTPRRHRRGRLPRHRHPRLPAHPGGARTAARPRRAPAPAGDRPGRGGGGGVGGRTPLPRRDERPQPADRLVPLPRAHRGRQDRAGAGAGRVALRRAGPDDPAGHERVPGTAHRLQARRGAPWLRRLRGGGAAH